MNPTNDQKANAFLITPPMLTPGIITPRTLAATPTMANGDLYVSTGSVFNRLAVGSNGSLLKVANGTPAYLAPGTTGQVLTMSGGAPSWQAPSTPTGKTLNSFSQTILGSTFTSVANTTEQECTGLKVTLPIVNTTCTVKVTFEGYVTYPNANCDVRIRMGTSTTATSNTEYAQTYGAAQGIYQTLVAIASLSLSTQTYANITVQSDTSSSISLSASSDRTQVLVEVYS